MGNESAPAVRGGAAVMPCGALAHLRGENARVATCRVASARAMLLLSQGARTGSGQALQRR